MKRLLFLGLLMTLGVALTFLSGCDEDKDGNGVGPGSGNPADSAFFIDFIGNQPLESAEMSLFATLGLLQHIPFPEGVPKGDFQRTVLGVQDDIFDSSVVSHNFDAGWHIFTFEFISVEYSDTVWISGIDSIKIWLNDSALQFLPSPPEIDSLNVRSHVSIEVTSSYDLELSGQGHHMLDITGNPFDTISPILTINAEIDDSLKTIFEEDTVGTYTLIVDYTNNITDIVVDSATIFDDDCPISGSMAIAMSVDLSCGGGSIFDSLNINGSWTLYITFNGDTMTATYSDGTYSWTITDECCGPPAVPWSRFKGVGRILD